MRVAFLSEGKLFLKEDGRDAVEIGSPFARESADRLAARNQRNAWKTQGASADSPYDARTVWGRQAEQAPDGAPVFRDIARGTQPGDLLYTLVMSASAGLFRQNLDTREEVRLFHRQDFDPCGLTCHPDTGGIFVASLDKDNLGKLEHIEGESRRRRQITSGDGHDSNPAHDPRRPGVVLFQTSGVARNESGEVVAVGPASIGELSLAAGEIRTVAEDEQRDFVAPRVSPDGRLHFIDRPFAAGRNPPLAARLKAFVLAPYTLALATVGFLDAFARLFAKRPLRPASTGPRLPESRQRFATFQGVAVDLDRALRNHRRGAGQVQLVPADWRLVRHEADGPAEVLAEHVVCFDIGPDGTLVYSDGLRLWQHGAEPRQLHDGHIIQAVAIV